MASFYRSKHAPGAALGIHTNWRELKPRMDAYAKLYYHNVLEVKRQAGVFTVVSLFNRNPVRTGQSRSNWRAQVGPTPDTEYTPKADSSGAAMRADAEARMSSVRWDTPVFWVSNYTPYIEKLESGTSQQAPQNWIRDTVRFLVARMNESRLLKRNGVRII